MLCCQDFEDEIYQNEVKALSVDIQQFNVESEISNDKKDSQNDQIFEVPKNVKEMLSNISSNYLFTNQNELAIKKNIFTIFDHLQNNKCVKVDGNGNSTKLLVDISDMMTRVCVAKTTCELSIFLNFAIGVESGKCQRS